MRLRRSDAAQDYSDSPFDYTCRNPRPQPRDPPRVLAVSRRLPRRPDTGRAAVMGLLVEEGDRRYHQRQEEDGEEEELRTLVEN